MVQMQGNRIAMLTYSEPQGMRVVARASDATGAAQNKATADALVRDGDQLVASGQLDLALDRYDRASILVPSDASLNYRIATVLDKQLRPIEALMRYQRFLQQMELERINAYGDAYAKQAEAIAHARERVIVLEKR
jgi:tetratricopeptide (TPR) repeat protein